MYGLGLVVVALWTMLPAYVPNNAAVLAGGGRPIDAGRVLRGRRILGDGKTWRGTGVGILAGAVLAVVLDAVAPVAESVLGVPLPRFPPLVSVALPTGAMVGDIAASFLKRRTGRERGAAFPLLDQLDFVVGALALTAAADPAWFFDTLSLLHVAVIVVVTPLLHVGTNVGAYLLGLKAEPW